MVFYILLNLGLYNFFDKSTSVAVMVSTKCNLSSNRFHFQIVSVILFLSKEYCADLLCWILEAQSVSKFAHYYISEGKYNLSFLF